MEFRTKSLECSSSCKLATPLLTQWLPLFLLASKLLSFTYLLFLDDLFFSLLEKSHQYMCAKLPQLCLTLCNPLASLSMGFSQEYWSGLPCPPPGDLADPGIKSLSPASLALAGGFFTTSTTHINRS